MSETPKHIVIQKVTKTRRFIQITYLHGDEKLTVKSNENPLPSLGHAFDALEPLVCHIMQLEGTYCESLSIIGASFGMLRDARTISIHAKKSLVQSTKLMKLDTPPVLLDQPKTEGVVTPPLDTMQVMLADTLVEEAKKYIRGERAQGILTMDEDEEDGEDFSNEAPGQTEPEAGAPEPLPFPAGESGEPVKKKRKKKESAS